MINIEKYIILFFIYSILGWLIEVIVVLIKERKIINRGFLIGPYCPIYGYGGILLTLLLQNIKDFYILLFLTSMIICSILEYLTSLIMEKIFHARWWDYSDKKFNINGRICLSNMIVFGLLGCFIIYISNPIYFEKISVLSNEIINSVCIILLIIYLIDNIFSINIIKSIKLTKGNPKDNTEEMTKKVKEILINKSVLTKRIVNAFPRMKVLKNRVKK